MSLLDVLNMNGIGKRKGMLSSYLKKYPVGELNDDETHCFKVLFETHYNPDEEHQKFTYEQIDKVLIGISKEGNKYAHKLYSK